MIKHASTCFAAMLLTALLVPAQAAQWRTEEVLGYTATGCSIDVGADGIPHLAFFPKPGGTQLHYSRRDPLSGWSDEIVSDRQADYFPDLVLKLDAGGKAHIAYLDHNGYLNVAENLQGPWTVDLVAQRQAFFMSMDLDAQAGPFIAYGDIPDQLSMHIARRLGSGWVTPKVTNHQIRGTAVAIDAGGAAHIVYLDVNERTVKYARLVEGIWTFETVETVSTVDTSISIALDNAGRPTAAYAITGRVRIAERTDESWRVSTLPELEGTFLGSPVVQLDARNNPHIAYTRSDPVTVFPYDLRYARRRPISGWQSETVDGSLSVIRRHAFALDRHGAAHIAYFVLEGLDILKYATNRRPVVTTP
jgi:hypothetical protein